MSTQAIAYLRVSGKSQVEGDGFPRQQAAIKKLASQQDLAVIRTFQDEGICGENKWEDRPAFIAMVEFALDSSGVRTVIVENLTRLARAYSIQEAILVFLASKGIDLISADTGENITEALKGDPMKVAIIQMQAVFGQLEKNSLVRKLKKARERKKAETGRCEGQKPYGAFPGERDTLDRMLHLRQQGLPIREVVVMLNGTGDVTRTRNGRPWTVGVVARILSRHLQNEPEFT